jgi:acetyl-CoA carboxylase carboxyltransferase component
LRADDTEASHEPAAERPRRLTSPRDWIGGLVDEETFLPLFGSEEGAEGPGAEVVAGVARVSGRAVALYAQDPSLGQGLVSSRGAAKIVRLMQRAQTLSIPILALVSSSGVDVQEGLASGEAYTSVLASNIAMSGVVPQLGAVMGVTMGAPAYSTTLMDLVLFNKSRSHLVVTGPTVVERMLGQKTTLGELGGSATHARTTGIAHFVDPNIPAQLERLKWLVGFLPSSYRESPPRVPAEPPASPLPSIPERMDRPFDMRPLVAALVDASRVVEYSPEFGRSIVTAFARLDGHPIGIVANQSQSSTGAIDADAAQKAARFIRICDAYGVTVLTLIDVPGFMPGVREEHRGLLRQGAHLCAAMQTHVPRLSLVVRRCYGAAAFVMLQSRAQGGDLVLALEGARIATMGFDAAKHMIYPDRIEGATPEALEALRAEYLRDYESPNVARAQGLIDDVLPASAVRERLARHLEWLGRKPTRAQPLRLLP